MRMGVGLYSELLLLGLQLKAGFLRNARAIPALRGSVARTRLKYYKYSTSTAFVQLILLPKCLAQGLTDGGSTAFVSCR